MSNRHSRSSEYGHLKTTGWGLKSFLLLCFLQWWWTSWPSQGGLEDIMYTSCVYMESIEIRTILFRREREIAFVKVYLQVLWMNPLYILCRNVFRYLSGCLWRYFIIVMTCLVKYWFIFVYCTESHPSIQLFCSLCAYHLDKNDWTIFCVLCFLSYPIRQ